MILTECVECMFHKYFEPYDFFVFSEFLLEHIFTATLSISVPSNKIVAYQFGLKIKSFM